jgi:hypothetical protein
MNAKYKCTFGSTTLPQSLNYSASGRIYIKNIPKAG